MPTFSGQPWDCVRARGRWQWTVRGITALLLWTGRRAIPPCINSGERVHRAAIPRQSGRRGRGSSFSARVANLSGGLEGVGVTGRVVNLSSRGGRGGARGWRCVVGVSGGGGGSQLSQLSQSSQSSQSSQCHLRLYMAAGSAHLPTLGFGAGGPAFGACMAGLCAPRLRLCEKV